MRLLLTAVILLSAPFGAQARFMPQTPPPSERMPGIADMGTLPAEPSLGRELGKARDLIRDGRTNGDLSKKEARLLRREARQIGALADRYGRDGLSDSEHRELETRVHVLRAQTTAQRQLDK